MNTQQTGIWDERTKTFILPSGTVKQGRRPMFKPYDEHDHLIAGEEKNCHQCTPTMNTQQTYIDGSPEAQARRERLDNARMTGWSNAPGEDMPVAEPSNMNTEQTTRPEPHDDSCQCTYCIPIVNDPTMKTPIKCHAPEHDHRYEAAAIRAERQDSIDNPATPAQAHSPLPWTLDENYHAVTSNGKLLGRIAGFSVQNERLILDSVNGREDLNNRLELEKIHRRLNQEAYQETSRRLKLTLNNEENLARQRNQVLAHAQRLADVAKQAMEFAIHIIEENAEPTLKECIDVRESAREALAQWEGGKQ